MRKLFFISLFLSVANNSFAQAKTLNEYIDKIYFNVYSEKVDTSIAEFLKKYAPVLYFKAKTKGNWAIYPEGSQNVTITKSEVHSFYFKKHPLFPNQEINGRLEIYTEQLSDSSFGTSIKCIQVWFSFKSKDEAGAFYQKLAIPLSKLSTKVTASTMKAFEKFTFVDEKSIQFPKQYDIVIGKNPFYSTYEILVGSLEYICQH